MQRLIETGRDCLRLTETDRERQILSKPDRHSLTYTDRDGIRSTLRQRMETARD